jgi:hypothetical protein
MAPLNIKIVMIKKPPRPRVVLVKIASIFGEDNIRPVNKTPMKNRPKK